MVAYFIAQMSVNALDALYGISIYSVLQLAMQTEQIKSKSILFVLAI